jgi:epoxyqueuosine reductase QueG
MKELTAKVKEVARKAGARLVGIAPVERLAKAPKGHRPNDLLTTAQSVISMACVMPYSVAATAPSASYMTYGYNVLNQKLHEMAFAVAWHLEEMGFQTLPMQNTGDVSFMKILEEWPEPKVFRMGVFSHRHAAVAAGLGEIGMNCALVSPQYGSRLRLVSVLTAAKLDPDPTLTEKVCDAEKCGYLCVKACPFKALPGDGTINHYRCLAGRLRELGEPYDLKRFKEVAEAHPLIRGSKTQIAVPTCGRCITSCPIGVL